MVLCFLRVMVKLNILSKIKSILIVIKKEINEKFIIIKVWINVNSNSILRRNAIC